MKKISVILGLIFCVSFSANAQIKYQNGQLTYGSATVYNTYTTNWAGWAHCWKSTGWFKINLHIADTRIGSASNKLVIYDTEGVGFLDLHCRTLYQYSDARSKVNITPISSGLSTNANIASVSVGGGMVATKFSSQNMATKTILSLNPVSYQFADQSEYEKFNVRSTKAAVQKEYGFLAQDIEKVLPDLVVVGAEDRLLVNYVGLIPILTAAIQELNARVEQLELENATLKTRIQ